MRKFVILGAASVLHASPVSAQSEYAKAMAGLSPIAVGVLMTPERDIQSAFADGVDTVQLRRTMETFLANQNVRVGRNPAAALIFQVAVFQPSGVNGYFFHVSLGVAQEVTTKKTGAPVMARTWQGKDTAGSSPPELLQASLTSALLEQLEDFVKAYTSVNGGRRGRPS